MSDSVRLQLLKGVQTALRGIARSAAYHNDVKATSVVLDPTNVTVVDPNDTPFFVVGAWEPVERKYATSRPTQLKETGKLTLIGAIDAPGTDTSAKMTAFENMLADLEVALAGSIAKITLNGQIEYLKVLQPEQPGMGLENQNRVIVVQPLELQWLRNYGQP